MEPGPRKNWLGFLARFAFASILIVAGGTADSSEPLFSSDEILEIGIRAPLSKLMRHKAGESEFAGSLELPDGMSIPMRCSKYGISRLRECQLASLKITVDQVDAGETPFAGSRPLRLVTPCRLTGGFDKFTVLEYLVYRSYAVLTDPSIGVRLSKVHFRDSGKPAKEITRYAFFIEDIDNAAMRSGRIWLDIREPQLSDLDTAELTLMTLFQYMVGNTDWSAWRGPPDDRCCHNVALFGGGGTDHISVVPFDFDQTGLVDAPYAAPAAGLGLRRVTERRYRGLCVHNDLLPGAIGVFNRKRAEIEALFRDDRLPFSKDRERALEYVGEFYQIVNDPRKLQKKVIASCR
jgi:hypothetical protein